MAYLIMGSYQNWRKPNKKAPVGLSAPPEWAVLRNMLRTWNGGQRSEKAIRELPSSWDQGFILASQAKQAKRRVEQLSNGPLRAGFA